MHLETRLVQLDSAISMELWQEAFKAVEDIHGLITLSKKQPKPSLMANYYQKLGLVFSKSGNHLFHACTLHRLFILSREQRKNLSTDELQKMASKVLCATLAIPIPPSRNVIGNLLVMDESAVEKQRKLATLLMLQAPPTRQTLVKDLVKHGSIQFAHPELQSLYQYLEVDFHPLSLYKKVKPVVDFIEQNEDLTQYVPQLEDIIITRVLKQVSQVYQQIKFSRFASLVPFASEHRLEGVIVDAAKTLELQVRIDHRTRSLSFGTDLGVSQKEDVPEGPYIQSMPSEQIRNQIIHICQALNQAMEIIGPKESTVREEEELKAQILNNNRLAAKKEHARILARRQIIENRKEQLEQNQDQREREEHEQQEEQRRRAYEAEMARLEREAEERNKQRQLEEHEQIKRRHVRERLEELRKTPHGSKILQNIDEEEIAELDVDEIMAKQVEQLEKEKKELQERLKGQEKKVDYLARAKRIEEIPLLQKQYEEDDKARKEFWEEQEKERIESLKQERTHALETKARLILMKANLDTFTNSLKKAKKSEYEDKLKEFERHLADERRKRMYERKLKRKEERRQKWLQEKEEAAQRARDEMLKREREEKEREEQERREQEEREYMERKAKLDEQMSKQRAREREIEEKEARRREEERKVVDGRRTERVRDKADGDWRHDDADVEEQASEGRWRPKAGGWRDREAEKETTWRARREAAEEDREEPPVEGDRESRDFRDGPRERDVRGPHRDFDDKRGPPRDRDDRDFRGHPRDEDRDARGAPREDQERDTRGPPREGRDFRGPPRDRDDFRGPPRDRDDFRGQRDRDDFRGGQRDRDDFRGGQRDRDDFRGGQRDRDDFRGPPRDRDDFRGPRRGDRDMRDDRDRRDFRDRGPPRDDGGPRDDWRGGRDDYDRNKPEDNWRSGPRDPPRERDSWRDRRDDRAPQSRDDWRGGERGPPRDGGPRGGGWRNRDDAGPPRDGPRGMPRDVRRDEPRRGDFEESSWRRGGPPPERDDRRGGGFDREDRRGGFDRNGDDNRGPRDDGRGPPRGERRAPPPDRRGDREGGGGWRRDGPREEKREPRGDGPKGEEDDGWTTVRY